MLFRCKLDSEFSGLYLPSVMNGASRKGKRDAGAVSDEKAEDLTPLKAQFPASRDAVDYIMEIFPIVKRKDEQKYGESRTKPVILEIYDEMAKAMRTGIPYKSHLNTPPGPPADAQGNFLPLPEWQPGQPKPPDWPPHIHPRKEVVPTE